MLTIDAVAGRLGVSLSFAHKIVRSGELDSYRFGRCRRVSEAQLQSYLDRCLAGDQDEIAERKLKYF